MHQQPRLPAADPSIPPPKKARYSIEASGVGGSSSMETAGPAPKPSVFAPSMGGRRYEVRKRQLTPTKTDLGAYYARGLEELQDAVQQILKRGWPETSKEILYRTVEDMCRGGKQDDLFNLIKAKFETHLAKVVRPRFANDDKWNTQRPSGLSYEEYQLRNLLREWDEWQSRVVSIAIRHVVPLDPV
jgi:hypothetical protein